MELDRRARKVMEANARRASYVAVISDAASLFSAVEVVISSAVAYFGHPRGDWPLPIRPLGRLVVVMPPIIGATGCRADVQQVQEKCAIDQM